MYGMRHPQKLGIISNNNYSFNKQHDLSQNTSQLNLSPSPSTPSLPGFAFAILAASFPLLRTKDSLITTSISFILYFSILLIIIHYSLTHFITHYKL